ncbi:MAG: FAD-dependent oxidoreductase [Ilumatobacteraceae bacterium]
MSPPVVVVGAGLAGLSCAVTLHRAGVDTIVVEKWWFLGSSTSRMAPTPGVAT